MVKKKKTQGEINKLKYIKEYDKKNYYYSTLKVRNDNVDVIEKLKSVPSKNAYILNLIEEDIKREL